MHGAYRLVWLPKLANSDLENWQPSLNRLHVPVSWHASAVTHLYQRQRPQGFTAIQHIVASNHYDIMHSLVSAHIQMSCGLLADGLTVLRPAIEHMIDIQFLKRWPRDVGLYDGKIREFNQKIRDQGGGLHPRDPGERLRFKNIITVKERLRKHLDFSAVEQMMLNQWDLLSNVADHSSGERKNINLRRAVDWENSLGELQNAALLACEQLYGIDPGLNSMITSDEELEEGYRRLERMFDPTRIRTVGEI